MMRKSHTKELKFKVALEAIKGDLTIVQIASKYGISTSCVHKWKQELLKEGSSIFDKKRGPQPPKDEITKLHAAIGRLKVENDFFEEVLSNYPGRRG